MRVKICGLTRTDDALMAAKLGAWALGFVLYERSRRYIEPAGAKAIAAKVKTPCVGVFVNQRAGVAETAKEIGLAGVQLHGDETPEACAHVKKNFSGFVIKAFRPETEDDLKAIAAYKGAVDYILLDSAVKGEWGGTGKTGDWALATRAESHGLPVILAGGLSAENILAAQKQVRFFAADLSSGVETSPGIKDAEKMKALFEAIKN